MLKLKQYPLLLLLMGAGVSWAQQPAATTTPAANNNQANTSQFSDPQQAIVVQAAAPTFTIRLASNPTTGYSWFLKKYNMHLLKLESHKYVTPQDHKPGAGGYQEWKFKVKHEGFEAPTTTTIHLVYQRPWEKKPGKEAVFQVVTK